MKKCISLLCIVIYLFATITCLSSCFEETCRLCNNTGLDYCEDCCQASGCYNCDGNHPICRSCNGERNLYAEDSCRNCLGWGVLLGSDPCRVHSKCRTCNGTGKVDCKFCEIEGTPPQPELIFD